MNGNDTNPNSNKSSAQVYSIKSPNNFWIRLDEHKNEFNEMMQKIKDHQASNELSAYVKTPIVGKTYIAFNQKLLEWQRCEILLVNKNDAQIMYIDVGSTDLVPTKSIYEIQDDHKAFRRFAINCSLDNIRPLKQYQSNEATVWSPAALSFFIQTVQNRTVTFVIKSKTNQRFNIEMYLKTKNVADMLLKEGFASKESEVILAQADLQTEPLIPFTKFNKPPNIELNSKRDFEMAITTIYSPYCFYGHLSHTLGPYQEFEKTLQAYYNNLLQKSDLVYLIKAHVGQMCIARYREDSNWYRSIVKEVDNELKIVSVYFVDYGNEDTIAMDSKGLLVINDQFKDYPVQAVKCCLNGVCPLGDTIANKPNINQIVDFMYEKMADSKLIVTFLEKRADECNIINLRVENAKGKEKP